MEVKSKLKHVFLITVDCLRADAVGCIDGGCLTPNIDKLAEGALVYRRAFANGPGTNQSFPAILTSTYFLMHGGFYLPHGYITLAEVMNRNGFRTVAFHSNPFLSRFFGWDRGFGEFYDFIEETKSPSAVVARGGFVKGFFKKLAGSFNIGYNKRFQNLMKKVYYWFSDYQVPYLEAKKLNQQVIGWIRNNRYERFFLWMHFMDPHPPLAPPVKYLNNFGTRKEALAFNVEVDKEKPSKEQLETLKDLYRGEVRYVDDCIGELIVFLEETKILEESLIVLLADHGHAFMEHSKFGHDPEIMYNEVLHVPLLIYGLGLSAEVDFPVQLLDISPTLLHIQRIAKPKQFVGQSLITSENKNSDSEPIFSESAKPDLINLKYDTSKRVVSCINSGWKLIINDLLKTTELYNIGTDFQEKKNLVDTEHEIYKRFEFLIKRHLTRISQKTHASFRV